jgi:hypothetical protein
MSSALVQGWIRNARERMVEANVAIQNEEYALATALASIAQVEATIAGVYAVEELGRL